MNPIRFSGGLHIFDLGTVDTQTRYHIKVALNETAEMLRENGFQNAEAGEHHGYKYQIFTGPSDVEGKHYYGNVADYIILQYLDKLDHLFPGLKAISISQPVVKNPNGSKPFKAIEDGTPLEFKGALKILVENINYLKEKLKLN